MNWTGSIRVSPAVVIESESSSHRRRQTARVCRQRLLHWRVRSVANYPSKKLHPPRRNDPTVHSSNKTNANRAVLDSRESKGLPGSIGRMVRGARHRLAGAASCLALRCGKMKNCNERRGPSRQSVTCVASSTAGWIKNTGPGGVESEPSAVVPGTSTCDLCAGRLSPSSGLANLPRRSPRRPPPPVSPRLQRLRAWRSWR